MATDTSITALVRAHIDAFNAGDVERLVATVGPDVVWATGQDTIRGREAVESMCREAIAELGPTLTITSLVADEARVACELVERYTFEGVERTEAIAAFFGAVGGQITHVKVYREGSADPG